MHHRQDYKPIVILVVVGIIAIAMSFPKSETKSEPPTLGAQSILPQLNNKNAAEKAEIKSLAIVDGFSKQNLNIHINNAEYGIEIGIVAVSKIDGGIEIQARAWKGGQQLGFGKDGSVDIERFKIYNPPILVVDPNGTIERQRKEIDGTLVSYWLREDPIEAITSTLAHTISIVGKEGTTIVPGKVGNTTSTFYPDANVETSSVDGYGGIENNATWAGARDGATATDVGDTSATEYAHMSERRSPSNNYWNYRYFSLFNTAAIPDTDAVDSATYSLKPTAARDLTGYNDSTHLFQSSPSSNTAIVAGDYNNVTFTSGGTFTYNSWVTDAYNDMTLNATAESWISLTGVTKLGTMAGRDMDNADPSTAGNRNYIQVYAADTAGTASDPKLVVVHSAPAAAAVEDDYQLFFE